MRWLLPLQSRKADEVEIVQERDYVESETSSKCTLSIRRLKCQVCFLNIIGILHKGISGELRLPVNVDDEILSSCLYSTRMHFFGRNIFSLTYEVI